MIHKLFNLINLILMIFLSLNILAQTKQQEQQIISQYDLIELEKLIVQLKENDEYNKSSVLAFIKEKNIPSINTLADGGIAELQKIEPDGTPIYYRTFNVAAANSTRTNHLNTGGSLGLNLMGLNLRAHVWDAGIARATHQEYDGAGGTNRFSVGDGSTTLNFHAAHVTGTIMASGFVPLAKGMAPHCLVSGYDWTSDMSEVASAAANGMLVSNHSYGYRSINDDGTFALPSYFPGAYIQESRDWDNVMRNAPYYLMVVAAGNDGNHPITDSPLMAGYDKLTGHSTSKNNLVIANAQDADVNTNGDLISVTINSSSSQGPTDDLRIKPDIAGNGTGVYSTFESSDSAYAIITGTSMAAPNGTGSLLLLQEHYYNQNNAFMRAATLKGLALHTADDAGAIGPDTVFGWGLLNTKKAAETITQRNTFSLINELTIAQGQTITIQVTSDGVSPLKSSISWTDLPGTATTVLNSNQSRLVNDLDIRVSKDGVISLPWILTAANANGLGDNTKDPYERIDINAASGNYTITITHKGTLTGENQNFSLIVTGITQNVVCNASIPSNLNLDGVGSSSASLSWDPVSNATYQFQYRVVGSSSWTVVNSFPNVISLTGLTPLTHYEAQVKSVCPDLTTSEFTTLINFTTDPNYCTSNGNSTEDEYIGRVELNTINNLSGAGMGGYSDFTNLSTPLFKGANYTLTITPTWPGPAYIEGYTAWIDYNKNGVFEDIELVFSQAPTTSTPVSGTFTIPATATDGPTRMRVSMKYAGIPTSCESFDFGEVEDYKVNIMVITWNGTAWNNGVGPTLNDNAIIDGDLTTTSHIICKDLTINSGRTLTIHAGHKLSVTGNLMNAGQIIFKSDAIGSGMFDQFTGTITGNGTVQVERYIPALRAFRFLTSAVTTSGSIRANWQENGGTVAGLGTHITGGASNGFDVTASNSPSMFTFGTSGWQPVTNTNEVLTAGTPYRLMVRGDRTISLATNTPTPTPTTLRATGALYTGDFMPVLNQTALGFSFIGNPYQAPMDIKAILTASTNMITNFVYYWDTTLNTRGAYVTRTLSANTNVPSDSNFTEILQPGQAVFVKKDDTVSTASMTIAETHKRVDQGSAGVFRTSNFLSDVGMIRVNLKANVQNAWQTIEGALAIFNDDYNWSVTPEDATKMGNLDEEVSFMLDGTALAIAFQNEASVTSTLPIQINKMRHTDYQWTFDLDNYNGLTPMLWDEQTQTMTAITNTTVIPFSTTATATVRFKIVFQETMHVDDFSLNVSLYPNPGKSNQSFYLSGVTEAKVSMQSLLGQEIPVTTHQNGQTMEVKPDTALSAGVYFVSVTQAGKTAQVKWIVE